MKVRGKNVFFLPHVSSKIWGAAVQFGTFFNIVVLLEITPISFTQFFFRKYDIAFYQVKLSLCTAWRQCGSQDMTNSSLNSVLRQWKVVSFTLQPFYSWYRGSGCDSSWLVHKFHKNSETTYKFLVPEGWHAVLYTAPTNLECSLHHNAIWCFCSVQVNWHILYVTKKKKSWWNIKHHQTKAITRDRAAGIRPPLLISTKPLITTCQDDTRCHNNRSSLVDITEPHKIQHVLNTEMIQWKIKN